MLKSKCVSALCWAFFVSWVGLPVQSATNAAYNPYIAPASNEAEMAMRRFRIPKGFKVELFAAEPLLANPVAFCIDEKGRFYVAETFRLHDGVTDIRGHMNWLDDDLASKSVEDRIAMMKKFERNRIVNYTNESDRLRLVWDSDGDGKADKSTVFSEGYNHIPDGIAAGVLARKGDVYFANIPDLWLLRDQNNDGVADLKKSLHYGYGVRVGFLGHDLHGLRFGPDGRLYFSIGDRGAHVKTPKGTVENHETGAVYRCNPDGSDLEIFAYGLRNPQELAFDQYGNLFTGDNNSDGGDPARWVYLVEGGDTGWRIGWQFIEHPNMRGPWLAERMCYPDSQVAYALPPIANIANGPSGLTYYPGTGLPKQYEDHFFLCDFRGGTGSGVYSFLSKPKGAGFELADRSEFVWEVLVTDCDFGYDGAFYISDWVNGWNKPGKGRIYRIYDPNRIQSPLVKETRELIAEGFEKRSTLALAGLLTHPDMRVRQEAQFELVARGEAGTLANVASRNESLVARLHGIWGLGQIARTKNASKAIPALLPLLTDRNAEVRAQTAKVLGDAKVSKAAKDLIQLLSDAQERPRFFAAIALGHLKKKEAVPALLELARANNNRDKYLRHAAVMGLVGCAEAKSLAKLSSDSSAPVRMAAVLALRRLESPDLALFLNDSDLSIVTEAARAINDLPVEAALPSLASKLNDLTRRALTQPATTNKTSVDLTAVLLRRAINANYRIGKPEHAASLASLAANSKVPEPLRTEALDLLGAWQKPSGRDQVTGLWRPIPARDPQIAATALQMRIAELLKAAPSAVKAAATRAAGQLQLKTATQNALELVKDTSQPAAVRVEALKSLSATKDTRVAEALKMALNDKDETVRKEAAKLQAQLQPEDATANLERTLERGTLGEKQSALATLGSLTNSAAAEKLLEAWLDKLLAGQVAPELELDVEDAANRRTTAAIREKLRKFEESRPAEDNLRSFRECLVGGDAAEGKKIFLEKAEVSCVRCHKVNGEGGEVGPDLTGVGKRQPREYLLESIVLPNKQIAAGFESVLVTLKSGTTYAGIVKSETATELELNSPEDGLLKIKKADIQSRERGLSAMPEEFRQILTKRELRDLVEFLATTK